MSPLFRPVLPILPIRRPPVRQFAPAIWRHIVRTVRRFAQKCERSSQMRLLYAATANALLPQMMANAVAVLRPVRHATDFRHNGIRMPKKNISPADKKWMGALPSRVLLQFGGRKIAVIHAAADSDNRFIFASDSADDKRAIIDSLGADAVIAGHSGIPFTQNIGGKIWHNSGALGMPANDGTPRVWYAEWNRESGGIRISHRALKYDFRTAQSAMRAAGLSAAYRTALQSGIWPSDDVLPPPERAQQGKSIPPQTHFWTDKT